jgi:hypothetical protein
MHGRTVLLSASLHAVLCHGTGSDNVPFDIVVRASFVGFVNPVPLLYPVHLYNATTGPA